MAILDGDNVLSYAQAETTATDHDSTNVIDLGAAHVGHNQKVIVTVKDAVTSDGSATVTFAVKTGSTTACSTTLFTVSEVAKATLVAGYRVMEFTLPWNVGRYLKLVYTIGTAALTGGSFNAYIDNSVQTNGVS